MKRIADELQKSQFVYQSLFGGYQTKCFNVALLRTLLAVLIDANAIQRELMDDLNNVFEDEKG